MVRLAHFSDIHISSKKLDWLFRDYFNKRLPGWINHRLLGRGYIFRNAERVLQSLFSELRQRPLDWLVFSGDATAMGFEAEIRRATELMNLDNGNILDGIAVPGNHDYHNAYAAKSGLFERYFAHWQKGERIGEEIYPFAQKVKGIWLIGINSSSGNRFPWDATGRAGKSQIERLEQLFHKLDDSPKVVVTHYPVCIANGGPESIFRLLRDLDEVVRVAEQAKVCLWLHGHRHRAYQLAEHKYASFPVICSGSATQNNKWSYGEYVLKDSTCEILRRAYDPDTGSFQDILTTSLPLSCRIPAE